jgi:hypothetical protein
MLSRVEAGDCDFLQGWRQSRKDTGFRRLVSRYGNRLTTRRTAYVLASDASK